MSYGFSTGRSVGQLRNLASYAEADALLGQRDSRKLAGNTYLVRLSKLGRRGPVEDAIGLRVHDTYVVTWYASGELGLNSGGWHSPLTKGRINATAPHRAYNYVASEYHRGFGVSVWTDLGTWYVTVHVPERAEPSVYRFSDCMLIRRDGSAYAEGIGGVRPMPLADPAEDRREYNRQRGARAREEKRREEIAGAEAAGLLEGVSMNDTRAVQAARRQWRENRAAYRQAQRERERAEHAQREARQREESVPHDANERDSDNSPPSWAVPLSRQRLEFRRGG